MDSGSGPGVDFAAVAQISQEAGRAWRHYSVAGNKSVIQACCNSHFGSG